MELACRGQVSGIWEVEQLLAGLVAESAECWPEMVGDFLQPGEPGPGLGVFDGRRSKGAEVAGEELPESWVLIKAAAAPGLGGGPPGGTPGAPDATRWDLSDGEQVGNGVRE